MKKRSYKITFGLKEGYSPKGKLHTLSFASRIIKNWMNARLAAKEPVAGGFLQEGKLFFPSVGEEKDNHAVVSACAIYFGELSAPEDIHRTNKEVANTLESLALILKKRLKQESVYIIYRDKNWCI